MVLRGQSSKKINKTFTISAEIKTSSRIHGSNEFDNFLPNLDCQRCKLMFTPRHI